MKIGAVITGDVVNSTQFDEVGRDKMLKILNDILISFGKDNFQFIRGDSFQVYLPDVIISLKELLRMRAFLKSKNIDIRMALGVGTVDFPHDDIGRADGKAFRLSGRGLDNLKNEKKNLGVFFPKESPDFALHTAYLDRIMSNWSVQQAEVVFHLLQNTNQSKIAEILKISQPAVNNRTRLAQWDFIEPILKRFEEEIKTKIIVKKSVYFSCGKEFRTKNKSFLDKISKSFVLNNVDNTGNEWEISQGEKWSFIINKAIEKADTFIFFIDADLQADWSIFEFGMATGLKKSNQIIGITLNKDIDYSLIPAIFRDHNIVYLADDETAINHFIQRYILQNHE